MIDNAERNIAICEMVMAGETYRAVAEKFEVSPSTVKHTVKRATGQMRIRLEAFRVQWLIDNPPGSNLTRGVKPHGNWRHTWTLDAQRRGGQRAADASRKDLPQEAIDRLLAGTSCAQIGRDFQISKGKVSQKWAHYKDVHGITVAPSKMARPQVKKNPVGRPRAKVVRENAPLPPEIKPLLPTCARWTPERVATGQRLCAQKYSSSYIMRVLNKMPGPQLGLSDVHHRSGLEGWYQSYSVIPITKSVAPSSPMRP